MPPRGAGRMKSIQSKFVTLSVIAITLCMVVFGGFGIYYVMQSQEESSDRILSLTCQNEANYFDIELASIEGAVDSCADIVESTVGSPASLSDSVALEACVAELEQLVGCIATHVPGLCTYYLRFEPTLSNSMAGFFYTKQGRDVAPTKETLTDILAYDPSDTEHVGWYYQPRDYGEPMWMDPYYNQNIDVYMVSYVAPLYIERTFVGVVGMDVDFNLIINLTRHIKAYDTGHAFLVSADGTLYYHPTFKNGTSLVDEVPELQPLVDELADLKPGEASRVVGYSYQGTQRKLVACGLYNGMCLVISADTAEMYAPARELMRTVAMAGVVIGIAVVGVVLVMSRRIARPLVELADVAHEVAEGNLDVTVPKAGKDEVGVLAQSLDVTISSLRTYIANVNDKAYKDPLTKVKNKAAYELDAEKLQRKMHVHEHDFALVMLDLNDLKVINDRYGHDHGDEYLRDSCHLICRVFSHSPVYRIGGDEFLVILENDDYGQRDALMAELDACISETMDEPEPWRRVSLAKGMATCHRTDATVEDVFKRADEAMYEDKRRMKGQDVR